VADIGTGSGAIALALATELPEAEVVAVDLDPAALEVARANAHTLGLEERIRFREGDGVSALEGSFDVIASNPPYIPTAELAKLAPEIGHEPRLALDGGPVGLAMIERLIAESPRLLRPGGALALEVGLGQADAVAERVRTRGASRVERRADLGGIERCVIGWWGTDGAAS
jgi:release factor glutamine methyltransferase